MSSSNPFIIPIKTKRFQVYSVISLYRAGWNVLSSPMADDKADLTLLYTKGWNNKAITSVWNPEDEELICPARPARQSAAWDDLQSPQLTEEKRRKIKQLMKKSSIEYAIHGIANAESYAIDLFWDIIVRFYQPYADQRPLDFYNNMVFIVEQEGYHYYSWKNRLIELGYQFGDFPFQDGLWQSATDTSHDILARLAIINLTHEAKGLDSYYKSREKLAYYHDEISLTILDHNYQDEIGHVKYGVKWFQYFCQQRDILSPIDEFHRLSQLYFKGKLKEPFNRPAREYAGMTEEWYLPISANTTEISST